MSTKDNISDSIGSETVESFGLQLSKLLHTTSLTMRDLMNLSGASRMTVHKWLAGENEPHEALQKPYLDELRKLARIKGKQEL